MHKKNFLISIVVFSILLFCTSIIKNKTRIIEKNIFEHNLIISKLTKDLHESLLDFNYLSSPKILSKNIEFLSNEKFQHMGISQIYLGYESFFDQQKKVSRKVKANE